jgi:hypothetical protein
MGLLNLNLNYNHLVKRSNIDLKLNDAKLNSKYKGNVTILNNIVIGL